MPRNAFPYPGNKARHAEWIIQHIPEHTCYVEPFGGAAGVLFNKPRSEVEVLNDRDGDIVQFFEVLRDRPDALIEWLEAVPFARDLWEEWATAFYDGDHPDDPVERAGRFFALRYFQWGGRYNRKTGFCTRITRSSPKDFKHKTERLHSFADRLREVYIENLDWRDLIDKYDSPETLFYCDPPYYAGRDDEYYIESSIGHLSLHDELLAADARAIVSYSDIPPFYDDGWSVVAKNSKYYIDGRDGHTDGVETLLMNFDSEGEPLMSDVGQQGLDAFCD